MARRRKRTRRAGRAAPPKDIPRRALVDCLRGGALIAMTVFHFAYDLEFFGLKERGYSDQFHWWLLATSVAGSFVFLTGVSLYLATPTGSGGNPGRAAWPSSRSLHSRSQPSLHT